MDMEHTKFQHLKMFQQIKAK